MVTVAERTPVRKEVKPINFLFYRTQTTVGQLVNFLNVAKDLQKEAVQYHLRMVGPVHWHYFGFAGDESKEFTLEVAVPVEQIPAEYDGSFHFKRTEPFRCVALQHEGPWLDLPQAYGVLFQYIQMNGLRPTGANREIYLQADFQHADANVTEVQIGIE